MLKTTTSAYFPRLRLIRVTVWYALSTQNLAILNQRHVQIGFLSLALKGLSVYRINVPKLQIANGRMMVIGTCILSARAATSIIFVAT